MCSLRSGFEQTSALQAFCPLGLKASAVPDHGKVLLSIDFREGRKIRTGANLPCALRARQQLPLPVKFAGIR
jgi:hypothetical protein